MDSLLMERVFQSTPMEFRQHILGRKVICYQLEFRKELANVLTECFSRHQGKSERSAKNLGIIAIHFFYLCTSQLRSRWKHILSGCQECNCIQYHQYIYLEDCRNVEYKKLTPKQGDFLNVMRRNRGKWKGIEPKDTLCSQCSATELQQLDNHQLS